MFIIFRTGWICPLYRGKQLVFVVQGGRKGKKRWVRETAPYTRGFLCISPLSLFVFGKHWEIILIFWHNSLAHLHSRLVFSPTPRPEEAELVKNSSEARRRQKNILLCTSPVETVLDYNFQILNLKKIVFPFHIDDPELNFKSIEFPLLFKKPFKNINW